MTISIFVLFILVKAQGADIKTIKLYISMLFIIVVNAVSIPLFSLFLQRLTLYSYKIEI